MISQSAFIRGPYVEQFEAEYAGLLGIDHCISCANGTDALYIALRALNVMGLGTSESAILSAVVFNALIIVALIPLALRGVKFRAAGAAAILRRNILIYGVGGLIAPFVGIKLIDLILTALGVH